jgi:glycosyltransferase involved in cell wall biosynthesis
MSKSKVIIVMPAYNAETTLKKTVDDIPKDVVDEIILVDDKSKDRTVKIAKKLGLTVYNHRINRGYGGNQKTCYKKALEKGADIIIMLHPDYQYDSSLIDGLIRPIVEGRMDIMFGSRIRTRSETLAGGMPQLKYFLNRIFCVLENIILDVNFSEHFSGFRAYKREVLETLPINNFSDDFVFDQELMISAIAYGYKVGEIPVPIRYFSEASSIQFIKGTKFLLQTLKTLILYVLYKTNVKKNAIFLYRTDQTKSK